MFYNDASERIGKSAALSAYDGKRGIVMGFKRDGDYVCNIIENKVCDIANKERKVPDEFIAADGNDVTDEFIRYCKPLIMGDVQVITEDGLPKHITR